MASMEPKIILASFPRSGNTFLRNIFMDVFEAYSWNNIKVYKKGLKRIKKLEKLQRGQSNTKNNEQKLARLKQDFQHRIIKTHELPKVILPYCDKDVKIIYLIRDGRDSLVSMAHHRKDITEPGTDFNKNLNEAIMAPMGSYFGGWGNNVEQWSEIADLVIYFEDLIANPEKEILKIKELLDFHHPKLENIPTFESQREGGSHYGRSKKKDLPNQEKEAFNTSFFRRGKVGGWKDEMPHDMQEKFWDKYGDVMKKHGYEKQENRWSLRLIPGNDQENNGLEIISVHIPKTAGRSFHKILEQVYGPSLDGRQERQQFFPDKDFSKELDENIAKNIRGIHGHLKISQLQKIIEIHQPKIITWVREPVERVISNYYYFMQRIRDGRIPEKQIKKKDYSLLDYAHKRNNVMTKTLNGMPLADFYFIGVMEQFDKDLAELASMMGWPNDLQAPHVNSNAGFKHNNDCTTQYKDIDQQMREEVAQLNKSDIELYLEVKRMRGIQ